MRPEYIKVRALSANEGSGTADRLFVAPPTWLPKDEEDIVDHSPRYATGYVTVSTSTGRQGSRGYSSLNSDVQILDYAFDFFFAAHRALINADNFFRMAALIGLRRAVFLEAAVLFVGRDLRFCFAHLARWAAAILARAAALIWRRFLPLAGLALGGRPCRAGCEPSPIRAAIACSI